MLARRDLRNHATIAPVQRHLRRDNARADPRYPGARRPRAFEHRGSRLVARRLDRQKDQLGSFCYLRLAPDHAPLVSASLRRRISSALSSCLSMNFAGGLSADFAAAAWSVFALSSPAGFG